MGAIALYARPSRTFDHKLASTLDLLRQAVATHARKAEDAKPVVVQASSLGAEDMVLSHLIDQAGLDIGIFVLQTGMLHAETLELLDALRANVRVPVEVYEPKQEAVIQFVAREGSEAMYRSIELRKACCHIRKMEPLERALAGRQAWITGLRREQSGARADVPLVDSSDARRAKYNPLADWSWGDVWHYIREHRVAYNPLHDQFMPSIGCAPCTRAIAVGEDFRAGRWWWESESAKECGLHVSPDSDSAKALSPDSRSESGSTLASAQADFGRAEVKGTPMPGRSHDEKAKECGLHVKPDNKEEEVTP